MYLILLKIPMTGFYLSFSSVTQVVLSTVTFFSVFPLLSEVFLIYLVMSCLLLIFKNRVPKSWLEALCTWLRFLYYRVIWLGHFIAGSSGVSFSRSLPEWKLQLITDLFLEPNNNAWHTWSGFREESSCLLPGAAVEIDWAQVSVTGMEWVREKEWLTLWKMRSHWRMVLGRWITMILLVLKGSFWLPCWEYSLESTGAKC